VRIHDIRTAGTPHACHYDLAPPPRQGVQGFGPNDVMYLIMPDRFANGDTINDRPAGQADLIDRAKGRYYHGGDLAGVQQKLPYLKQLGITAIWLNPIYDNNNALNRKEVYDGQAITDYHGYGATDFYNVEEHFGTVAQFRQLVDDAHKHGIKIVLTWSRHSGHPRG
jgi:glycosidase